MNEEAIRNEEREESAYAALNVLRWAFDSGEISQRQYDLLRPLMLCAIEDGKLPQNERV